LSGEPKVEEELYRVLKNVLEKNNYTIEGVRFLDVEPQKKANSGRADLVVMIHPSKALLVIECKKKIETAQAIKIMRQFDPLSSRVIDQALNYAVHLGAAVIATTNGNVIAVFVMPEKGEPFRIDRHRLLIKEVQITEDIATEVLTLAARVHAGLAITKTPLDWAFIVRLRSFVDYLASQLEPPTTERLKSDLSFQRRFEQFREMVGAATPETYAREAAYILMNKIIFYKILERSYPELPRLTPLSVASPDEYAEALRRSFREAIFVTKDFEPVFSTGIYDEAPLPSDSDVLDEINSFIEEMGKYRLEEIGSDVVGFIYENLIKDDERHRLGQFYTPPQIAELIVRWAIRESTDIVLDPAVGSGTFLVKAYAELNKLKPLRPEGASHKEILSQLVAIDINPFPSHLTAVNLAMRDVQHPTSEMNIVVEDFFNIPPRTTVLAPFAVKSADRESKRKIMIPDVDAVVANPPYTRYGEISASTLKAIDAAIGQTLTKYGLRGGIRGAVTEIGIYVDFVVHATSFLKEGGRLGMIVSNGWLQTKYGVAFGKFLLANYKVKAVIDFSNRLFRVPLIATCVILAEKCSIAEQRNANDGVFAYVNRDVTVDSLLDLVEEPSSAPRGVIARKFRQSELEGDQKWIQVMFNPQRIEQALIASPLIVNMKESFQPLRGNTQWSVVAFEHTLRPNVGPEEFFYLDKGTVSQWGLEKYAYPAITSIRYAKFFTFTKKDWADLAKRGAKAYFFICHLPKSKLPRGVSDYVDWGESKCRTTIRATRRGGLICSQTWVCKEREKYRKQFFGWYDLGGVVPTPIFAVRHGWYKTRFTVSKLAVAMYDAAIAILPKKELDSTRIKAAAAYLNSTFAQLYIETHGRATSGGVIGLETNVAEKMPILDVRKLGTDSLRHLAHLFDKLEDKARKIGGADKLENLQSLRSEIDGIDRYIAKIIDLPEEYIELAQTLAQSLMQRRTSRMREARPEAIVGEEIPRIKPPRRQSLRAQEDTLSVPLDRWT